jgi:glycosyltransferase involved in cell wall biosynthesis
MTVKPSGQVNQWFTRRLLTRRSITYNGHGATNALMRPAHIILMDVERDVPHIPGEDHYQDAWIVLFFRSTPRAIIVLDLSASVELNEALLRKEFSRIREAGHDEPLLKLAAPDLPSISVVVPTIAQDIGEVTRCVDGLGNLEYPDFEVILVDNRLAVPTPDSLSSLTTTRPWLRVVREPRPGISAARNRGIAEAKAAIIAFTDDDVSVDREWLRAAATRFVLEPQLDVVTGLVLPLELENATQVWYERYFGGFGGVRSFLPVTLEINPSKTWLSSPGRINESDSHHRFLRRSSLYGVGRYVVGANMVFRKSALERIHGFDVALGTGTPSRGGEDLAATISVLWSGGKIGYEPSAFVFHRHRREYSQLLNQLDGSGIGFTAMLTSLVRQDPRHAIAILVQLPLASARLAMQGMRRLRGESVGEPRAQSASRTHLYPSRLFRREFMGYFRGPLAYARSVGEAKRHQ